MERIFGKITLMLLCVLSLLWSTAQARGHATEHSVVRGESLWKIAKHHGTTIRALQDANASRYPRLAAHPDHIEVGWTLAIPQSTATEARVQHTVASVAAPIAKSTEVALPQEVQSIPQHRNHVTWTNAGANRCRMSFPEALKAMGDSDELIALFQTEHNARRHQWVRLESGERYEAMCFGKHIARNVRNALPNTLPEWAYWAREYTVEKDGVRYRRRIPLVCGNILKLPDEQIPPQQQEEVPPRQKNNTPLEPPETAGAGKTATTTCECGELFRVIARIGPLPARNSPEHHNQLENLYRP